MRLPRNGRPPIKFEQLDRELRKFGFKGLFDYLQQRFSGDSAPTFGEVADQLVRMVPAVGTLSKETVRIWTIKAQEQLLGATEA